MRLEKLELCDLWSYAGPSKTVVSAFGQVNVVIGRNNVGKSNLMRAIRWVKDQLSLRETDWKVYQPNKGVVYNPGEAKHDLNPSLRLTFLIDAEEWRDGKKCESLSQLQKRKGNGLSAHVEVGFESFEGGRGLFVDILPIDSDEFALCCNHAGITEHAGKEILRAEAISYIRDRVILLDGWRRLSDPMEGAPSFIEFLHGLQSSTENLQSDFRCLQRVQSFFCELTGLKNVQINVRQDKLGFNVAVNGRNLPLSSYGDGISHLFMIAARAAVYEKTLILIEEPETHLHPDLQRHLLRFLTERLSAQIILTTHSPVLLDNSCVDTVIRVDHFGERSMISPVETSKSVYGVLDDIGARASDILQANVVIWVEGPSDRIFLKRGISLLAKELVEGLHFQIVCYGGALRAHLTFDQKLESLINILSLSRNVVMICDSDRDASTDELNDTKSRLKTECEAIGGLYWITQGREIENYLTNDVLTRSYKELLKDENVTITLGQFDRLSSAIITAVGHRDYGHKWKIDYDSHKAELMKYFVENIHSSKELERYDLLERLREVVEVISRANNYRSSSL
jgi:hypothetical protein